MVACKQMDLNKCRFGSVSFVSTVLIDYNFLYFAAKSSISAHPFATKTDDSKITDMKNELYVLKKLSNPYIVKLYCHFVVNNVLYIFIKLANGGNFAKYVKEKV